MENSITYPAAEEQNNPSAKRTFHAMSHEAKHTYYTELVAQALARYNAETGKTSRQADREDSKQPAKLSMRCEPPMDCSPVYFPDKGDAESGPSCAKLPPGEKDTIQSITDHDVLFGRRSAQRNHPGNIRLRELCSKLYPEYKVSNRAQKTSLTWQIVSTIKSEGGRFLKSDGPSSEAWRGVSNDTAREKVAFTIRDLNHSNADCDEATCTVHHARIQK